MMEDFFNKADEDFYHISVITTCKRSNRIITNKGVYDPISIGTLTDKITHIKIIDMDHCINDFSNLECDLEYLEFIETNPDIVNLGKFIKLKIIVCDQRSIIKMSKINFPLLETIIIKNCFWYYFYSNITKWQNFTNNLPITLKFIIFETGVTTLVHLEKFKELIETLIIKKPFGCKVIIINNNQIIKINN